MGGGQELIWRSLRTLAATALLMAGNHATLGAEPAAGHITGIGGVFFKSKDPKALTAWYREVLGLPLESWGGAALRYDAPEHPPVVVWSVFAKSDAYFDPSTRDFMINFAVDDLDAMLAKLKAKGVVPLKRDDQDPNGRFAWIMDPDGNKLELWEPKKEKASAP
jgi:catechol 2,3-dioxygenase-like lactoylglutathione lyase family enzyme